MIQGGNNTRTYDKGNSLLGLRGAKANSKKIMRRIQSLCADIGQLDDEDPVRRALDDLTGKDGEKKSKESGHFFLRNHVIEEILRLRDDELIRYLRYRYAYDVNPQMKIVHEYPPLIQIEPTSICNYRCVFCYQIDPRLSNKKNGHMGMMDFGLFKHVVDQLEGNIEGVTMASRGEPTVHKKLPEMLRYLSGKFLATKLNTNAFLLDERMAHAFLETDVQTLVFSADAASEPLYSQLRVNGNLERVVRNIEQFYNIKEKYYPNSRLITRVSGVKYHKNQNMNEMESFWNRYVDQVTFVDYNPWENIYDSDRKWVSQPCSDLWRRMFVWWDGKVGVCDVDYLTKLNNESVLEKSISEIWQGKMYTELRQRHLHNERQRLEPCSRCIVI